MGDKDLETALAPVRAFFSGRTVSKNTVLAAHMRAAGLPVSGEPWSAAKEALKAGGSFKQAVEVARGGQTSSSPKTKRRSRMHSTAAMRDSSAAHGSIDAVETGLVRYAKPFGPGDLDGSGAQRLLGTPSLDRTNLLVRETAQNSWDAGISSAVIDFSIDLRTLTSDSVQILKGKVFTDNSEISGLQRLLSRDSIRVVEIADRGTVGLNGPIRNDLAVDPGSDTNFIDLVFNVGAPRDVHLGGGTYGFGKTIAFLASRVGTILLWTRCQGAHGLEYRLIGSAVGDGYSDGDLRYTGRHWWGDTSGDVPILPLVGESARILGEAIFALPFTGSDTGTSILILDPDLDYEDDLDFVSALSQAIRSNLWPKLLKEQDGIRQMRISLLLNGSPRQIDWTARDEQYSAYAHCLAAVRKAQGDVRTDGNPPYVVHVSEIRSVRPGKLLGHLALVRFPVTEQKDGPLNSVALMRNQAELVVRYLERGILSVDGFCWAGVFKPVSAVDDSFAMAEPPAHDDWISAAVSDKRQRRDVNVAMREIRSAVDKFLLPSPIPLGPSGGVMLPTAALGDSLADLVASSFLDSSPVSTTFGESTKRRSSRSSTRAGIALSPVGFPEKIEDGWMESRVEVKLVNAPPKGAVIAIDVSVGIEGGSWHDESAVRVLGWVVGPSEYEAGSRSFGPTDIAEFAFLHEDGIAIDVVPKIVSI